jgi:hypothetical protein
VLDELSQLAIGEAAGTEVRCGLPAVAAEVR